MPPNVAKRNFALISSGLVDVIPERCFYIPITNFSYNIIQNLKHMLDAVGGEAPVCIVHMAGEEEISTRGDANCNKGDREDVTENSDLVNGIHYKSADGHDTQTAHHKDVK